MRFTVRYKAVADVNDVKTKLIKSRRIVFVAAQEVKDELAKTSIQITCFDRNGNIVKRVTSDDEGVVEESENEPTPNPSDGGENNGNGNGNDNGGNTGGDDQN